MLSQAFERPTTLVDIEVRCTYGVPEIDADYRAAFVEIFSKQMLKDRLRGIELERRLAQALKVAFREQDAEARWLRRFDDRPSTDVAIQRGWVGLMGRTKTNGIDDLLNSLLGQSPVHRKNRSTTFYASDETRSVFPLVEEAAGWLDRIDAAEQSNPDPFAMACFAYAQTVLSHPYEDGNGRLARAMYQRSLGRSGLLSGPLLPLGPLVYANARVHDRALQHLGATGNWDPFVNVMLGLTRKAAAFTRHILAQEAARTGG